jgi:hypothetical protein
MGLFSKGSHIDPGTGRNKRETGAMAKRRDRNAEIRADGMRPAEGGGIRRQNGRPAESRVAWRQREATRGAASRQPEEKWLGGPDASRMPAPVEDD